MIPNCESRIPAAGNEAVFCSDPFRDGRAAYQVFLQNPLEALCVDVAIPDAFGVNHEPRSAGADAEALGLCPHRAQGGFTHAALDVFPDDFRVCGCAAVRPHAEEYMPLGGADGGFLESGIQFVVHVQTIGGGEKDGRFS